MTDPESLKRIEKAVRSKNPQLLKNLPGEKKQEFLDLLSTWGHEPTAGHVVIHQSQVTTMPVPPAELLLGYEKAFPDGAQRLFTLVENQSNHRQSLEKNAIAHQARLASRGQIFAFVLAVIFGGIGLYLGISGQAVLAGTVFTTTIGGLLATFIVGQKNQQRNLDKKAPKAALPGS